MKFNYAPSSDINESIYCKELLDPQCPHEWPCKNKTCCMNCADLQQCNGFCFGLREAWEQRKRRALEEKY